MKFKVGDKVKVKESAKDFTNITSQWAIKSALENGEPFLYVVAVNPYYIDVSRIKSLKHEQHEGRIYYATVREDDLELYEEFPTNWAIKRTEENHKEVNEWFRKKSYISGSDSYVHFFNSF